MPRIIFYILLVVVALTLVPAGLIYKSMHSRKAGPRIQVVYDMDQQYKSKSQSTSSFFADGVAMRKHPEGTVARGRLYVCHFGVGYGAITVTYDRLEYEAIGRLGGDGTFNISPECLRYTLKVEEVLYLPLYASG